jgi:hypothetical protein
MRRPNPLPGWNEWVFAHIRTFLGLDLCIAGRSATVAAAYIMYSQNLDVSTAIDLIRKVRPIIKYVSFASS